MKSIRLRYNKSSKEEMSKYGGQYEGFSSIYRYCPDKNRTVFQEKVSFNFFSYDNEDAMFHFDSIIKKFCKNWRCKHFLFFHKIDKITLTKPCSLQI